MKEIKNPEELQNALSDGLVALDFWADWCGPCKTLAPHLERMDEELDVEILKVSITEVPELASEYMIQSIPTLVFFKDGVQVDKVVGSQPHIIEAKILELSK